MECLSATNAGEKPETAAAKRELPSFLPGWCATAAQRAYADWLRRDGQPEVAVIEDGIGCHPFEAINQAGPAQRANTAGAAGA